ncbi:MAG: hypothetical protein J0I41_02140 [Filimonas sp.]|nr:hypothetical protein [Filimonas sp.]
MQNNQIDKRMPVDYDHLISQEEYSQLVDIVLQYFIDKGEDVIKLEDAVLTVKDEQGKELKYGFDNLVRFLVNEDKGNWESVIYSHFNKTNFNDAAYKYFFKDYEEAKQYLRFLVKDEGFLSSDYGKDLVYKTDFPGTVSLLVFDYDNQFRFIKQDEIEEWGKTEAELFGDAVANIANEDIEIRQAEYENGVEIFMVSSGDFAASFIVNIAQNLEIAIGKFGSVIAIPAKGTVIASPINDTNPINRVELLGEAVSKIFEEEPGNISADFYWFYEGKFTIFPKTASDNDGYSTVFIPEELAELLKQA